MLFSGLKQKIDLSKRYKEKIKNSIRISDNNDTNINELNNLKVAIHFHIFYIDLLEEIYNHLKSIKTQFTLFITVISKEDEEYVSHYFNINEHFYELKILLVENRGRDIYPFYLGLHECYKEYDIIAHLHTKKSKHCSFGDYWRKYLYNNLLGKNHLFDNVINLFNDNKTLGFVTTPICSNKKLIDSYYFFKDNRADYKENIAYALDIFNVSKDLLYATKENMDFPCGNMFIARSDAIRQFFEKRLTRENFPDEKGQLDGTLQHFVERIWKYIVVSNNYEYKEIISIDKF